MQVRVDGELPLGVIGQGHRSCSIIGAIGIGGGIGHVIEYTGQRDPLADAWKGA